MTNEEAEKQEGVTLTREQAEKCAAWIWILRGLFTGIRAQEPIKDYLPVTATVGELEDLLFALQGK